MEFQKNYILCLEKPQFYCFLPEEDYKDRKLSPEEAIKFANLSSLDFPSNVRENIQKNKTGFTVLRGCHPSKTQKRKFNLRRLCEKFRKNPQSVRILKRKPVSIIFNDEMFIPRLLPEEILPMKEFETPIEILVPTTIDWEDDGNKETILFANDKYQQG